MSAALHLPTDTDSVKWRWLTNADIPVVHGLFQSLEAEANPSYRTTYTEIEQLFHQTHEWLGALALDPQGLPVGFVHARLRLSDPIQVRCNSGLLKDHRSTPLQNSIIDWQGTAGTYLTRMMGSQTRIELNCSAQNQGDQFEKLLQEHGYEWASTIYEMRGDLEVLPENRSPGDLIAIEPWNPSLEDLVRLAALEFAPDTANSIGRSLEHWMSGRENFAPELSFIALDKNSDRSRVAGFIMCATYPEDWEVLGWSEGYIDLLEVGKDWLSLGIARELIVKAMYACRNHGFDKLATAVSSHHEAELAKLFGSLGFRDDASERTYAKTLS